MSKKFEVQVGDNPPVVVHAVDEAEARSKVQGGKTISERTFSVREITASEPKQVKMQSLREVRPVQSPRDDS